MNIIYKKNTYVTIIETGKQLHGVTLHSSTYYFQNIDQSILN